MNDQEHEKHQDISNLLFVGLITMEIAIFALVVWAVYTFAALVSDTVLAMTAMILAAVSIYLLSGLRCE